MFVFFVTEAWHGAFFCLIIHSYVQIGTLALYLVHIWMHDTFYLAIFMVASVSILCLLSLSIFSDLEKQLREPSIIHDAKI